MTGPGPKAAVRDVRSKRPLGKSGSRWEWRLTSEVANSHYRPILLKNSLSGAARKITARRRVARSRTRGATQSLVARNQDCSNKRRNDSPSELSRATYPRKNSESLQFRVFQQNSQEQP